MITRQFEAAFVAALDAEIARIDAWKQREDQAPASRLDQACSDEALNNARQLLAAARTRVRDARNRQLAHPRAHEQEVPDQQEELAEDNGADSQAEGNETDLAREHFEACQERDLRQRKVDRIEQRRAQAQQHRDAVKAQYEEKKQKLPDRARAALERAIQARGLGFGPAEEVDDTPDAANVRETVQTVPTPARTAMASGADLPGPANAPSGAGRRASAASPAGNNPFVIQPLWRIPLGQLRNHRFIPADLLQDDLGSPVCVHKSLQGTYGIPNDFIRIPI